MTKGANEFRGVVVAANIDAVDFNDLVGWNVVVGDRGVGVSDEKSAVWRRGNCGIDRNVGGWIDVDNSVQEPARHWRADRISARVEEMRQQTVASLRIFVDDDEVAIGKRRNGGVGLRSGHPTGASAYAEIGLLFAERGKSRSHGRLRFVLSAVHGARRFSWGVPG